MIKQVEASRGAAELVVIRHAQSQFNQGFLSYRTAHKLEHLSWYQCVEIADFNRTVAYAREYIDCGITQEGREQCRRAREMLRDEQLDLVLVSPHQRALETCREIFEGRQVRVEVHPLLAEAFRFSCDISANIEEKKRAFPEFDFRLLKDHSELWFLEILSDRLKQTCAAHLEGEREVSYAEKQQRLLGLLQAKVVYESAQELRARMWKVKEVLDQYRKLYKRIAIVTHFEVLESLLAKSYNEQGETAQLQMFPNAVPFTCWIDDLLAVK